MARRGGLAVAGWLNGFAEKVRVMEVLAYCGFQGHGSFGRSSEDIRRRSLHRIGAGLAGVGGKLGQSWDCPVAVAL